MLHLQITPAKGHFDYEGSRISDDAKEFGIEGPWKVRASRGFLFEGELTLEELAMAAESCLVDRVIEVYETRKIGEFSRDTTSQENVIHVLPKPGVTDPQAESAIKLLRDHGFKISAARSIKTYNVEGPAESLDRLTGRVLANDAVEECFLGELPFRRLGQGSHYSFRRVEVEILGKSDEALLQVSKQGQLHFSLAEFRAIEAHFHELGRQPTDCELETLAQTWSEHCSHKTLRGRINFNGEIIDNLLKQTIFGVTNQLKSPWLVSVFSDNAGVVRFDDHHDVCFKVETHNHPSAIDPYGGANTGLGGVIRDPLGTGLGAKPICNTNVFCVAPPNTLSEEIPSGVLHPRRILKGVVAGVRDYGNRMGIPTVNGALVGHPGYLSNPLVFCGTIGVLPKGMSEKSVRPGDRIIAIGGRTGRDGIHGATFSSVELSDESGSISGGAVQIGNAITQKMVLDVVIRARDRGLFRSITDCGAGGFSSAIGEMGAELGAEVDLDMAPLKYEGLTYTEIWISEAQERMVLAVPPDKSDELLDLCSSEGVEATNLGQFADTGRLVLRYEGEVVADMSMHFLHEGRPPITRNATWVSVPPGPMPLPTPERTVRYDEDLRAILGSWDVCSKEWIVRQYDHEVQARTVVKPLVGVEADGPGDASVILPVKGSERGLAVGCGINPRFGLIDPYRMAGNAIDEAIRNCVAVGANPEEISLLDNFCWGNTERPETLGSLVRAAQGCRDVALAFKTPFISGKDSLYNEYNHDGKSLAIPPTLLISAMGPVPDVRSCVTMDLKERGNAIVAVGSTKGDLGASHWGMVKDLGGGNVPRVDLELAPRIFRFVHSAINKKLVKACHDVSEGGFAVALAEMAFAGGLGASVNIDDFPRDPFDPLTAHPAVILFSESPSRFLIEVEKANVDELIGLAGDLPVSQVGFVMDDPRLIFEDNSGHHWVNSSIGDLKESWQQPLDW